MDGLREVAERYSEHGSWNWLSCAPLLHLHGARPRLGARSKSRAACCDFDAHAAELLSAAAFAAATQRELARSSGSGGGTTGGLDDEEEDASFSWCWTTSTERRVRLKQVVSLVRLAPSPASLAALCKAEGVRRVAGQLEQAFASRVRRNVSEHRKEWGSSEAREALRTVVARCPALRGPELAAALLASLPGNREALEVVRLCCAELPPPRELTGAWQQLSSGARDWLADLCPANDPDEATSDDEDIDFYNTGAGTAGTAQWLYASSKKPRRCKRPLSERRARRAAAAKDAASLLDALFACAPALEHHPSGLLFSLLRCWPFKASTEDKEDEALRAIVAVLNAKPDDAPKSKPLKERLVRPSGVRTRPLFNNNNNNPLSRTGF